VVKGIGTDIVNIQRIKNAVSKFKSKFQEKIFTKDEWAYCWHKKNPYPSLAARFAAKEAVFKALGTGKGSAKWVDVEVRLDLNGKPSVFLTGTAAEIARSQYISNFSLSISHCSDYAVAFVVAE
jgi:holo-[acyl-carrier protein] synthase